MHDIALPSELLRDFIEKFYGYGSLKTNLWFVGLEEGGGNTRDEVRRRLATWNDMRRPTTADIETFHRGLHGTDWFGPNSKSQNTWRQLIRIALVASGSGCDDNQIIEYQRTKLGRAEGATLLELMPLPSRSTRAWSYDEADLPDLKTRRTYQRAFRQRRADELHTFIRLHEPKTVVFYGGRRDWPKLLNVKADRRGNFDVASIANSLLYFVHHPTSFGARNEDFVEIGRLIRARST